MIVFLSGLKNYGEFCELRMTTSQPSSRDDTHTRCLHANLLWVCEFQQCLKTDPVYDWEKKHSLKGICELRMTTRVEIGEPELHCSIGHHTRNLHSDRPPNSCGPDVHDCKKQSLSIFPVVLSTGWWLHANLLWVRTQSSVFLSELPLTASHTLVWSASFQMSFLDIFGCVFSAAGALRVKAKHTFESVPFIFVLGTQFHW